MTHSGAMCLNQAGLDGFLAWRSIKHCPGRGDLSIKFPFSAMILDLGVRVVRTRRIGPFGFKKV